MREEEFEWADVVKIARDFKYGTKITGSKVNRPPATTGNPFAEPPSSPSKTPNIRSGYNFNF